MSQLSGLGQIAAPSCYNYAAVRIKRINTYETLRTASGTWRASINVSYITIILKQTLMLPQNSMRH